MRSNFSLLRQIAAIEKLCSRGMRFWDYGNAFLVECHRAGADILAADAKDDKSFKYPSYMQDIMGFVNSRFFQNFSECYAFSGTFSRLDSVRSDGCVPPGTRLIFVSLTSLLAKLPLRPATRRTVSITSSEQGFPGTTC